MIYKNGCCACSEASKVSQQIGTLIMDYLTPRLASGECTQLEAMALMGYFYSSVEFPIMTAIMEQRCKEAPNARK